MRVFERLRERVRVTSSESECHEPVISSSAAVEHVEHLLDERGRDDCCSFSPANANLAP